MNKSWKEVKEYLKDNVDSAAISPFEIIKRSGLSRDAYYKIFGKGRENSPMRRSTVYGLANALNLKVEYAEKLPQFTGRKNSADFIPLYLAREAIQYAIGIAGGVEALSRRRNVTLDSFVRLISPTESDNRPIPINFLTKAGSLIGLSLQIDPSGKAEYSTKTEEHVFIMANDEIDGDLHLDAYLDYYSYPHVTDVGLDQLFENSNIQKFHISELERRELFLIATFRNSQTTLDHWVSILYALRALEQK